MSGISGSSAPVLSRARAGPAPAEGRSTRCPCSTESRRPVAPPPKASPTRASSPSCSAAVSSAQRATCRGAGMPPPSPRQTGQSGPPSDISPPCALAPVQARHSRSPVQAGSGDRPMARALLRLAAPAEGRSCLPRRRFPRARAPGDARDGGRLRRRSCRPTARTAAAPAPGRGWEPRVPPSEEGACCCCPPGGLRRRRRPGRGARSRQALRAGPAAARRRRLPACALRGGDPGL